MKNTILVLISLFIFPFNIAAQNHTHTRIIDFPNVGNFKSVVCDFHQHTVFSDGSVWPDIRVKEALKDSVDAISLTEHLEYLPHKDDIPHSDRNRSYEIAAQIAKPYNLLVINGAEITRDLPPGHVNAIFIQDANKLLIQDSVEVFREVKRQGGFSFWNHPNWIAQKHDGIVELTDMHKLLIKEDLLHGIEVVNELTYSDEALQVALDNDLTIMGTSDIHGLIDWNFKIEEGGHRPITIVLSKEKSPEGIKEGLFARRTVVFYNHMLIGKKENLVPLLEQCIEIKKAQYQGISSVVDVSIYNNSSAELILGNRSKYTFHNSSDILVLPPKQTTMLSIKTKKQLANFSLPFTVLSGIIAPNTHPDININVSVKL